MATTLLFFLLSLLSLPPTFSLQLDTHGSISVLISEKGLVFVKDLLVQQALLSLTPLHVPSIKKSINIPFIGGIEATLSNITLLEINVSSTYIRPGDTGVVIVASGAMAHISMDWKYSYSSWLIPVDISDGGGASVQVDGLEVGLTLKIVNHGGSLNLIIMECGCSLKDISITLDGGASWFYQGIVNAFEEQIISAVETAVTKKIKQGIRKLDLFLENLPKKIPVDDISTLNVTFVSDPLMGQSSISFEINGLFMATDKLAPSNYHFRHSQNKVSCSSASKMLGISLNEAVFNSASATYFSAGFMSWIVDKIDQSLLNTAGWRFIIPQLYKKYPNADMNLNISLSSPPYLSITRDGITTTVFADMTIDVLNSNEITPVACISMVVSCSGSVEILKNNLTGQAGYGDFRLQLKWSKVGNFHMYLIQAAVRVLLADVFVPYVNSRLRNGFPLPIIHGFTLSNADIIYADSRVVVCTDVEHTDAF
ncbi:putative BPI/LBP family protein At1g04970 [Amborella trichopoda]|uniref:Lipid-binding serum glycoprotein C-terminal domain-containing protein n=1 Tax=Amborella trichopoda TaxID=13333 RepID=W1NVL9_AMBTC|nr:putative BPI/LBP family protein At1g04970 [Amborella trichopoda]ERN01662.1 hypothetical protein AMTR_s00090p00123420 [Amborella trichopoda]|eukprot:XP_006839093.1 putative BPI/LBP family protein At1g04970 [Amborella trichopoda]